MDGYLKLDKMLDWQVANYPLRMSEKARLMALPGDEFSAELDWIAWQKNIIEHAMAQLKKKPEQEERG